MSTNNVRPPKNKIGINRTTVLRVKNSLIRLFKEIKNEYNTMDAERVKTTLKVMLEFNPVARKTEDEMREISPNLNDPTIIEMKDILNKICHNINPYMKVTCTKPFIFNQSRTLEELGYTNKTISYIHDLLTRMDIDRIYDLHEQERKWYQSVKPHNDVNVQHWKKLYYDFYTALARSQYESIRNFKMISHLLK